jgi:hypothetical protein
VIFITLMGFAAGTHGAFGWIWGTHLHGASSLLDSGLFDGDLWWRRFTSLWWMVMVDGHLVVWCYFHTFA